MIIILDSFFIQFSDFLIKIFLKIIDFIISIINVFNNEDNSKNSSDSKVDNNGDNSKNSSDSKVDNNGDNFNFSNTDFGFSNNFRNNQNLSFKSKMEKFFKNDSIFEDLENRYYNGSDIFNEKYNLRSENYDLDLSNKRFFESIEEKLILVLLNNRFLNINESNFYNSILKLFAFTFALLSIIALLIGIFISFELGLAVLLSFFIMTLLILYFPKIKKQNEYSSFSKELPYALRQLATELRSGKSLFDSLDSVVQSDYGVVSLEFSRVLEEIKYGESSEKAFLNLEKRVNSKALSRVIHEILASLRIGSNLSSSLSIIAEDINFDIRIKFKEYSERLNAFIMIYTFLAILAPVILLTLLLAASVVIGDLVPNELILILYSVFFPMIIVFLGFAIKKLEPKI